MVIVSRFAAVAQHDRMWAPRPPGRIRQGREEGQLHPQGELTNTPAVGNEDFWRNVWNDANGLPAGLPPVTANSPEQRRPADRVYEALGSNDNPGHFTLLQGNINGMKGRIEIFNAPMVQETFDAMLQDATDPSNDSRIVDIMSFLAPLRELVGVFQYLRADEVVTRLDAGAADVLTQLQLIELNVADSRGLSAHWNAFYPQYFRLVSDFARTWGQDRINQVRTHYEAHPHALQRAEVLKALKEIEDDIPNWKYKFED
jgi:chitinase